MPTTLLQSQTNCTQHSAPQETGGKGTSQLNVLLMEGRAVHISDNLFPFLTQPGFSEYHSLTQLLSTSPVHPTHGTQHTPNVIPLTSLIPCHQDQCGKPQQ